MELIFSVAQLAVISFTFLFNKAHLINSLTASEAYPFRLSSLMIPYPKSIFSATLLKLQLLPKYPF